MSGFSGMILEVEGLRPKTVKSFPVIERALNSLKSYGPRSYAILTNDAGEFIQVAGGKVTCIVEVKSKETT